MESKDEKTFNVSALSFFKQGVTETEESTYRFKYDKTPETFLTVDKDKIPRAVHEAIQNKYSQVKSIDMSSYAYKGDFDSYDLGCDNNGLTLNTDQIVASMLANFSGNVLIGVDLGTGYGQVPKHLNSTYPGKVRIYGVTAEDNRPTQDEMIINGNIESLSELLQARGLKPHLIFSNSTMTYMTDPLKVMVEIYQNLAENGYMFLSSVRIFFPHSEALFEYLRIQSGIDISWGFDRYYPSAHWVFIKKNNQKELHFPVYRTLITQGIFSINPYLNTRVPFQRVEYGPTQEFIDFKNEKHTQLKWYVGRSNSLQALMEVIASQHSENNTNTEIWKNWGFKSQHRKPNVYKNISTNAISPTM